LTTYKRLVNVGKTCLVRFWISKI